MPKALPSGLGIFETREDGYNFLYDILVGVRSHRKRRGKMRRAARWVPESIVAAQLAGLCRSHCDQNRAQTFGVPLSR